MSAFDTNKYREFVQAIGRGPNRSYLESKVHSAKYRNEKCPIEALLETNPNLTKDDIKGAVWTDNILLKVKEGDEKVEVDTEGFVL